LAASSKFLSGTAAAGGIALINSIGNLGGYIGPFIVGWIKDSTNSFKIALYFLAACSLASGVVAFFANRACGVPIGRLRGLVNTR
jgi:ACS family tartrate transporter-like MFS transporter